MPRFYTHFFTVAEAKRGLSQLYGTENWREIFTRAYRDYYGSEPDNSLAWGRIEDDLGRVASGELPGYVCYTYGVRCLGLDPEQEECKLLTGTAAMLSRR